MTQSLPASQPLQPGDHLLHVLLLQLHCAAACQLLGQRPE